MPKPTRRKAISTRAADPVEAYALSVRDGKIVAGPLVRLACSRHLADLREGHKRGLKWDWAAGKRAIGFFPDVLRLAEGEHAGKPFDLQPWELFVVGSLFGWKGSDGYRRFRTCYAEIGKGNGKSPLAAGIGIYGLMADGEAGAEVYSAATTRDQAKIVWGDAKKMVDASPALSGRIDQTVNNLAYPHTMSFFRPVSADASKLDGFRPHFVIADEVHEHPNALVIDKMRAGFKGRRQPLLVEITNSGFDRHSICWQHHEYSAKVLEGTIENDAWFAYICALDEGDDWTDERVWLKANPNLGISVTLKYLRGEVKEALEIPARQNIVRRLNFCEWTEQSVRAIDMATWNLGGPAPSMAWPEVAKGLEQAEQELRGRKCFGGLDLARVNDLSSFELLFPPIVDQEPWKLLSRFWVPEDDIMQRARRDRVPYDAWRDHGFLIATAGNTTDYAFIGAQVLKDSRQFDIREIAFDRTFAGEIVQTLMSEGLTMVEFGQGFISMAAPTAELMRMIKARILRHYGHPVLRWNASNLAVATDPAGNMKPDKSKSVERIDGISAICNALGRALVDVTASPYSDGRGILVV